MAAHVAVVPFATLLESLPDGVEIQRVMTDTQGFDYRIVSSVLKHERYRKRIRFLRSEVQCNAFESYAGAGNDLGKDWLPFMEQVAGYRLTNKDEVTIQACLNKKMCRPGQPAGDNCHGGEANAEWERID